MRETDRSRPNEREMDEVDEFEKETETGNKDDTRG